VAENISDSVNGEFTAGLSAPMLQPDTVTATDKRGSSVLPYLLQIRCRYRLRR